MAEESKSKLHIGRKKKTETLRERSERATQDVGKSKTRHIRKTAGVAARPFKAAHRIGKKEYYLPMPKNRFGRFMNKRRRLFPSYFKEAFAELKKVEWPNNKTTIRLTLAVFIFSIVFGTLIAIVDYGLDKVFKKVFLS